MVSVYMELTLITLVIGLESINSQSGAKVLRGLPLARGSQNLVDSQ